MWFEGKRVGRAWPLDTATFPSQGSWAFTDTLEALGKSVVDLSILGNEM